jgi:hypothetical protein
LFCLWHYTCFLSFVHSKGLIDLGQCKRGQSGGRDADAKENCASGECFQFLKWYDSAAEKPVTEALRTYLAESVDGLFIVEGLIVNTLLGRAKDPMFFHAGN